MNRGGWTWGGQRGALPGFTCGFCNCSGRRSGMNLRDLDTRVRNSAARVRPAEAEERGRWAPGLHTKGPGISLEPSLAVWSRGHSEPPRLHLRNGDELNLNWWAAVPPEMSHLRSQCLWVCQVTRQRGITVEDKFSSLISWFKDRIRLGYPGGSSVILRVLKSGERRRKGSQRK